MNDEEIQEVREVRRRISQDHGHDLRRLFERYRELESDLKGAGHKFVEPAAAKSTNELVLREQPPNKE
jgi:hypothetical protein